MRRFVTLPHIERHLSKATVNSTVTLVLGLSKRKQLSSCQNEELYRTDDKEENATNKKTVHRTYVCVAKMYVCHMNECDISKVNNQNEMYDCEKKETTLFPISRALCCSPTHSLCLSPFRSDFWLMELTFLTDHLLHTRTHLHTRHISNR